MTNPSKDVPELTVDVAKAKTAFRLPTPTPFKASKSRFDREQLDANPSEFHGFINLFLMSTLFYVMATLATHYRSGKGSILPVGLLQVMFQDIFFVMLADACLILFTFSAFIVQKIIVWKILPIFITSFLSHLINAVLFSIAAAFIYYRDWPWIQSGSLMIHAIVLYMKIHSYMATNRQLAKNPKSERPDATLHYPNNVTLFNFVDFLLVPTLVYEPEYPRTDRVRLSYLVEKAIGCIGAMTLLYLTISNYMFPVLEQLPKLSLLETVTNLTLPFMVGYLLIFYIIFECICNFMAEVTRFADRSFYDDWWNSTNFDEFSRKWNKPVHEWLLRHIYLESMTQYKMSKQNATAGTFFFSMILHELALTVAGRRFRPYIMILAMLQMPLIPLMRQVKGTRIGNCFFWFSQIYGVPMLACLYAREHYGLPPPDMQVVLFFLGIVVSFFIILGLMNVFFWRSKPHKHVTHEQKPQDSKEDSKED